MSRLTVALVTMKPMPPKAEHRPIAERLVERGLEVLDVAWDRPHFDWSQVDVAVLRSTWDYHLRRDAFLAWAKRVPRLLNPARIVEWNSHKGYLRELERLGVPTVPTAWAPPGAPPDLEQLLATRGWPEAVVKPAVSGGAWRTVRCARGDTRLAQQTLEQICLDGEAMIQPYLSAVETSMERSLVYIDGVFAHAVRRAPVLKTHTFSATLAAASDDERWVADAALRVVHSGPLLYARVDLIRDDRGDAKVLELELIEPALYLDACPATAAALAEAIARRVADWR